MKIVHATWELRNLGVDCKEITVESNDGLEEIKHVLQVHETEYTVLRLPVARTDLLFLAHDLGYRFIETMTYSYHMGEAFNLNSIQKRIVSRISWRQMDDAGMTEMFDRIERGMFTTDRVSLDPHFSRDLVLKRYVHWINDELAKGGRVFKMLYDERDLGFFTLRRQSEDVEFAFLNGIYDEFRTSGFGFACHYCEIVESFRSGAKRVFTAYSSNNRGAAAVHLGMGHVLHQQCYVFVKHGQRSVCGE